MILAAAAGHGGKFRGGDDRRKSPLRRRWVRLRSTGLADRSNLSEQQVLTCDNETMVPAAFAGPHVESHDGWTIA